MAAIVALDGVTGDDISDAESLSGPCSIQVHGDLKDGKVHITASCEGDEFCQVFQEPINAPGWYHCPLLGDYELIVELRGAKSATVVSVKFNQTVEA